MARTFLELRNKISGLNKPPEYSLACKRQDYETHFCLFNIDCVYNLKQLNSIVESNRVATAAARGDSLAGAAAGGRGGAGGGIGGATPHLIGLTTAAATGDEAGVMEDLSQYVVLCGGNPLPTVSVLAPSENESRFRVY
jgi:hypothetical protein